MKKNSLGQGILPVAKAITTTAATTGHLHTHQTEATMTTPTIHYLKPSWRLPFINEWINLPY